MFLVSLWLYLDYEEMPSFVKTPRREYDFIIVGAGTAGSVVAHELVKHSNFSVLLIEAGEKFGVLSRIPLLSTALQGSYMDWAFKTVPQKYSSKGLLNQVGEVVYVPSQWQCLNFTKGEEGRKGEERG